MDPELQKLEDLYSAGFIFEEEYVRRRAEICQQLGLPEPASTTTSAQANVVDDSSWRSTAIDTQTHSTDIYSSTTNTYNPYDVTSSNADTVSYDIQQQPFSNTYDAPIGATTTYVGSISTDEFISRNPEALALSGSGVIGMVSDSDSLTDPHMMVMGSSGDDHVRYAFNNTSSHLNELRVSAPSTPVKSTPKESRLANNREADHSFMDCSHIFTTPIRDVSYEEIYNFTIPPSGGVIVIHRSATAYVRTPLLPARSMTLSAIGAIFGMSLCELFRTNGSLAYSPLNRSTAPLGQHVNVTSNDQVIDSGVYYIRHIISHLHFAKNRIEIVETAKAKSTDFLSHEFGSHGHVPPVTYVQWCNSLLPGFNHDWMTPSDSVTIQRAQAAAKVWYQNHPAERRKAWLHFLVRLRLVQHNASRVKSVKKAALSTESSTLVNQLEQHIAEHRCIITGELDAVPGSFLCQQYHDDELIALFNKAKQYSTEQPEDHGEVVLSENWDAPPQAPEYEYDPEKRFNREVAEVRAEYEEKPKFSYIELGRGATMPSFRNHTIANFTQQKLADLFK